MKKILISAFTSIFLVAFAQSHALASELSNSYSFNKLNKNLCLTAKNNQVAQMRSLLLKERTHIRNIYLSINCDGRSLMQVAQLNRADRVVEFLTKKTKGLDYETGGVIAIK